jgi:uncharacterized OsmC-like protein
MSKSSGSIVKQRQDPLREHYRSAAEEARIADHARTIDDRADPFHGAVVLGEGLGSQWPFGIHRAVGGYHDGPNPGDMLCAALASCLDSTIRMVADRLEVPIKSLEVDVSAEVDVRGTLLVDRTVPVGFQDIDCRVRLQPAPDSDPTKLRLLYAAAEHSCVVLQTLRHGVQVRARVEAPFSEAENSQPVQPTGPIPPALPPHDRNEGLGRLPA